MKRIIIFIIAVVLYSCNKVEDKEFNTYRVTVKENFTDPLKQLENIQVDDYVPYTITLTDSKEAGEYKLIPVKEKKQYQQEERYHQTIGKDFVLSFTNEPNIPIDKEQKYLNFSSKGTHNFYIRPLVPGTFKLAFELQKFVGGEAVGEAIKVNVNFNAVKIRVAKPQISPTGSIPSYTLIIDDGSGEGDDYIANKNVSNDLFARILINDEVSERSIVYLNTTNTNSFGFLSVLEKIQLHKVSIKYIRLTQKINNLPDFKIEYHNIEINSIE